jgi:hypothetical protein
MIVRKKADPMMPGSETARWLIANPPTMAVAATPYTISEKLKVAKKSRQPCSSRSQVPILSLRREGGLRFIICRGATEGSGEIRSQARHVQAPS